MSQSLSLREAVDRDGYVVVRNVVPRSLAEAVVQDIYAHVGASPDDPSTWYRQGIISGDGMVEMYHYPSMWNTRQHPRIHEVFSEIYGTPALWVTFDRANLKPPASPDHPAYDRPGFIHWDTDISKYPDIPFGLQGVLALVDTDEEMGGFQCIPEIYRNLGEWVETYRREGRDLHRPDFSGCTITKVPLQAGDMVIWSTQLPHGNGRNVSDRTRLAQYISMHPAREDEASYVEARIESFRTRHPMHNQVFPGDPRQLEETSDVRPELTPLGRKLLGMEKWTN